MKYDVSNIVLAVWSVPWIHTNLRLSSDSCAASRFLFCFVSCFVFNAIIPSMVRGDFTFRYECFLFLFIT